YWPAIEGHIQEPDYQELYARWFEYGIFCPIFRSHGHRPENEFWSYPQVEPILTEYDKLRYRLMPYIYSLAWKVTSEDSTIMRPLVMDFRSDPNTWNLGDQFMFGPAILVNPILKSAAKSRSVYLPGATAWYDFWTGASVHGEQTVQAEAPLDRIPLYVRAGSILPMGPEIEYAGQNPEGPIELRVYRGADGRFDMYQDSGDSYDYTKGRHAVIPIRWDDKAGVLTLGAREGSYAGMPATMRFRIVLVGEAHGVGEAISPKADRDLSYNGSKADVRLER